MRPWLITPAERRLVLLFLALTLIGGVGKGLRHLDSGVVAWLEPSAPITRPERAPGEPPEAPGGARPVVGPKGAAIPPVEAEATAAAPAAPAAEGVDPNRAGAEELVSLPGIGPVLAGRIVADRTAKGPFLTPQDLLRVPGIGPATLARCLDHLRFSTAAPDS